MPTFFVNKVCAHRDCAGYINTVYYPGFEKCTCRGKQECWNDN